MRTLLKSANGQIKGYLNEAGPRTFIYDPSGNVLGWYDKNTDKTYNKSNTVVAMGNQVMILLN